MSEENVIGSYDDQAMPDIRRTPKLIAPQHAVPPTSIDITPGEALQAAHPGRLYPDNVRPLVHEQNNNLHLNAGEETPTVDERTKSRLTMEQKTEPSGPGGHQVGVVMSASTGRMTHSALGGERGSSPAERETRISGHHTLPSHRHPQRSQSTLEESNKIKSRQDFEHAQQRTAG